ncbi:dTMP kinase [Streptantibioticus ferralitis]|uniref:Thymidylate kinase n=1 Tax=Streptantibioticus ferralitis TaxID=236510 RepID=A0ABT5Z0M6_9ACTN|nr:dTMP kinase [Streptantibioticus ferralitis]MDF2257323.1 dTMP kinase [Streptantibioticus ferralitis]
MTYGRFVTLDGPGGVGKSTTLGTLAELLRRFGTPVHTTAEPSSSALGQFTRSHADQIQGRALACLVAADRYEHIRSEIQPHLDGGETVMCDRYLASTLVVQQLDGVPERFLLDLNADILLPDLSVILTADPQAIRRRLAERGAHHRFERDPKVPAREAALYRRADQTMRRLGVPVLVVDTTQATPSDTAKRIASALRAVPGSVASGPIDR